MTGQSKVPVAKGDAFGEGQGVVPGVPCALSSEK